MMLWKQYTLFNAGKQVFRPPFFKKAACRAEPCCRTGGRQTAAAKGYSLNCKR